MWNYADVRGACPFSEQARVLIAEIGERGMHAKSVHVCYNDNKLYHKQDIVLVRVNVRNYHIPVSCGVVVQVIGIVMANDPNVVVQLTDHFDSLSIVAAAFADVGSRFVPTPIDVGTTVIAVALGTMTVVGAIDHCVMTV